MAGQQPAYRAFTVVKREGKRTSGFRSARRSRTSSPFLQAYYRRVAERYLSSQGELKSLQKDRAL
jgi:hypothetical protein